MCYSLDFRRHVFKVKEKECLTFKETSNRFCVPMRTLFRWQQRIEPKLNRFKSSTKVNMELLLEDVKEYPDSFQYERAKRFKVSQSAIYYALKRLNISYKKKHYIIPRLILF